MDWLARMNCAMDYIEAHLDGEISYDEITRLACCSTYHFQRMFPLSQASRFPSISGADA